MDFQELLYEAHAPFVTLTLNRPQSENKMTPTLAREAYFKMVDLDYASALDLGRLAFVTMLATREK
ncbi:MAG: hypothetical protein V3T44_07300 [bacterium]